MGTSNAAKQVQTTADAIIGSVHTQSGIVPYKVVNNGDTVLIQWSSLCVSCCVTTRAVTVTSVREQDKPCEFTGKEVVPRATSQICVYMKKESAHAREYCGDEVDEYEEIY